MSNALRCVANKRFFSSQEELYVKVEASINSRPWTVRRPEGKSTSYRSLSPGWTGDSRGPEWLSSHPNPGNREERIAQEARLLRVSSARRNQAEEFSQVQASLRRMSPARTMAEIASNNTKPNSGSGSRYPDNARVGRV